MNSKAAVNAVLEQRQPDYIPLGTYAIDFDTAEKILGHETYVRNKIKIQIALWEGRRDEVAQSLAEDTIELFKKLPSIDIIIPFKEAILLPPKGYVPEKVKKLDDTTYETANGTVYKYSGVSNDITVVKHPDIAYTEEMFNNQPLPKAPDPSIFEVYNKLINAFKDERFIAGCSGGFRVMPLLGGMEEGLIYYLTEPEMVQAAINANVRNANAMDQYYINPDIDAMFVEVDTGSTTGTLMSPELFRTLCYPAMKERITQMKKYKDKVILHSCGKTWKLIDTFIDAGVDCLQSLQTNAGMDLPELMSQYSGRLSFWGGVSVEHLISGTMDDVRNDVRTAMNNKEKGGFILGPSHSIAYGVKYDNFMAMLDEHDKLK